MKVHEREQPMTTNQCSACEVQASTVIHTHALCQTHATEMVTYALTDGLTPGEYLAKSMLGTLPALGQPTEVSSMKDTKHSRFMRHGALPEIVSVPVGANRSSGVPTVRSGSWVNNFRIMATDPRKSWRVAL